MFVGTCGWSYLDAKRMFGEGWRNAFKSKLQAYASLFDVVEVNSTFYKLPREETAKKWLREAREVNRSFEFTVKVWKRITHELGFAEGSLEAYEEFKPIAVALDASILLFQTPASFKPTEENIRRLKDFFSSISQDFNFVFEVRGKEWKDEIVGSLFSDLGLVHVVDPFRRSPAIRTDFHYFRLHGSPPGKRMYRYKYTREDLEFLKRKVAQFEPCYVMFNNIFMYEDALSFKKLLARS